MRRLQARERLPGYGHKIYVGDDPRLAPLLELVASCPIRAAASTSSRTSWWRPACG